MWIYVRVDLSLSFLYSKHASIKAVKVLPNPQNYVYILYMLEDMREKKPKKIGKLEIIRFLKWYVIVKKPDC